MKRQLMLGAMFVLFIGALACEGTVPEGDDGPRDRHRGDETRGAQPNPDPKAPRTPGPPPPGMGITFRVRSDRNAGNIVVTWNDGRKQDAKTIAGGTEIWGTVVRVGTPVSILAVHAHSPKRGNIFVQISRDVGGEICHDSNENTPTGGANCAGIV